MDGGSKVSMKVDESPRRTHAGAKCLSVTVVHGMSDTNLRVP